MKKYIPGTVAIALMYLFIVLAYTLGPKSLFALPVIVFAQYKLLMPRKRKAR